MKNLLKEELGGAVETTGLSKKLTIDGIAKAYPVYRVRLDQLFYNDQNDRIATWISQYKNEHGDEAFAETLKEPTHESYNAVIEQFIVQSNETAIEKTQMNIALVHQREPGVILSDGRIIDGNRRFTCLRRLALKDDTFNWFETVILDTNIETSRKQIKMLELAIQHGEEKKVDYNPVDRLVGVYQDIVETELLTVEEYAFSTNETVNDVKKRIESAMLIAEFLEFIHMPKQWHIARDYQVVSAISDMQPLLRKCNTVEMRQKVKNAVFANIMMHTIGDSRKYVNNLSAMMNSGFFPVYIKEQDKISYALSVDMEEFYPKNKGELELFISNHEEEAEALQMSLDKSLLKAKKHETRNRPSQIVSKSITLLKDVDTRIFEKLTDFERDNLKDKLDRLSTVITGYTSLIESDQPEGKETKSTAPTEVVSETVVLEKPEKQDKQAEREQEVIRYYIASRDADAPYVHCHGEKKVLTTLCVTISFTAYPSNDTAALGNEVAVYKAFFIDASHAIVSDVKPLQLIQKETSRVTFTLLPKAAHASRCYLALQSASCKDNELEQLVRFETNIPFAADFAF